ncbi:GrpE [Candidatus Methanoplasma termitum]|uniref:GrpE n=1 Tax=Candidatus Methanoplasma termitum TaxID=1577791 RepID=A0A0A7LBZ5_9ARCH|nr:nucleotide exchange factor GrpE [Candidatus Methanoplasma termitum]AIZ56528.1 GrpE [Candidatus Methanoplasma termitum]MCL2333395.1 nucleotide exchange factor GrpE [Candidatus Methanoplasma sp.]
MTEKKISNKTAKLKNFLVTGSVDTKGDERELGEGEKPQKEAYIAEGPQEAELFFEKETIVIEDVTEEPLQEEPPASVIPPACVPQPEAQPPAAEAGTAAEQSNAGVIQRPEPSNYDRICELEKKIENLTSELGKYTTTKDQLKEYSAVVSRRDTELANRKFIGMLEQLSAMREDFFKLCAGINTKLDSFSAKDVLSSFEAYGVDMENILIDCGVQIGPSKFDKLNTMNQRIVDVIPTGDEVMNGMIAKRVSDGYVYQGRVLLKEKVVIYRYSGNGNGKAEGDEEK